MLRRAGQWAAPGRATKAGSTFHAREVLRRVDAEGGGEHGVAGVNAVPGYYTCEYIVRSSRGDRGLTR
jgi:hypothetical protein